MPTETEAALGQPGGGDRLLKLERDIRRLRRLLVLLALIVVVLAGRIAISSRHLVVDLLEARALLIYDAGGKVGIQLTATPSPQANFFDDDHRSVLYLGQRHGYPEVILDDISRDKEL